MTESPAPLAILLAALRGVGAGLVAGPWTPRGALLHRYDARGAAVAVVEPFRWGGTTRWGAVLRVGRDALRLRNDGAKGWRSETAALDACDTALGASGWVLLDRLPGDPGDDGLDLADTLDEALVYLDELDQELSAHRGTCHLCDGTKTGDGWHTPECRVGQLLALLGEAKED